MSEEASTSNEGFGLLASPDEFLIEAAPLYGVARDASGKYCPANAAQWAAVMSVAGIASGGPSIALLHQETAPSSNLADPIGGFTFALSGGPPTYGQTIAGWSRFGITGSDAATTTFTNSSASLPDPATSSILVLTYDLFSSAPAANRVTLDLGTGLSTFEVFRPTPVIELDAGSVFDGLQNPVGVVRPVWFQYNVTANTSSIFTDQEKIVGTKRATTGKRVRIMLSFPGSRLYGAVFFGAAAELSAAQIKTLSQTLGWTIPWS